VSDTIYAPATARGRSALAVIRISGPHTRFVVETITGALPEPRRMRLSLFRSAQGEVIDQGLCVVFPGPASPTGEDCAEFHCHGSPSVVSAMLEALSFFPQCRLALPGEFARRALANGRMDLAEIEGLGDLLEAETSAQRRQALRQMLGALGRETDRWREDLLMCSALIEADLDFSDEGDVDRHALDEALRRLKVLRDSFARALEQAQIGERVRDGFMVVLAGPPNAGKSTLLNLLARRDVAIVSPIPGTTRDIVEVRLDLGGYPVTLVDTAGMRESSDEIEREGMRRMITRAATADAVIWLCPPEDRSSQPPEIIVQSDAPIWRVATQSDRAPVEGDFDGIISAVTGEGIDDLVSRLNTFATIKTDVGAESVILTRARHREAVMEALESVDRALENGHSQGVELLAEDLRLAARAIGRITGHVGVEDILDRLFSTFCIGK
jgi:tRNA modification GTPase